MEQIFCKGTTNILNNQGKREKKRGDRKGCSALTIRKGVLFVYSLPGIDLIAAVIVKDEIVWIVKTLDFGV